MTNPLPGLLDAICREPGDDGLRLICADALDEAGQHERAEFIRIGCELATLDHSVPGIQAVAAPLEDRERELFRNHALIWMTETWIRFLCIQFKEEGPIPTVAVGLNSSQTLDAEVIFHRGFVSAIHCRLADWCGQEKECPNCSGYGERTVWKDRKQPHKTRTIVCPDCKGTGRVLENAHGPQLVKVSPLERVVLTDKEPSPVHDGWWRWWDAEQGYNPDKDELPTEIWELAHSPDAEEWDYRFNSREDALDAASHALLTWARAIAFPGP